MPIAKSKYKPIPHTTLRRLLAPYAGRLTDAQCTAIETYMSILLLWNQKINLTSLGDRREIIERHFGESFMAARFVDLENGRLADVGSGAGFPGLALKILCPVLQVLLIESNAKKAAFLAEIGRRLQLDGLDIYRDRFEHIRPATPFHFVSARAVGNLAALLKWSRLALLPQGKLLLWLGADTARSVAATQGWRWHEPVIIPKSLRRVLLIGEREG